MTRTAKMWSAAVLAVAAGVAARRSAAGECERAALASNPRPPGCTTLEGKDNLWRVALTPAINYWRGHIGTIERRGVAVASGWKQSIVDVTIGVTFP